MAEHSEVVVIGAGPGGYTAAFRAADLGKRVTLVERYPALGGVCLNVGCIPSKALLHTAQTIRAAAASAAHGVRFGKPTININEVRHFKDSVVKKLSGGIAMLAKQRGVTVVHGDASFVDAHTIRIVNGKDAHDLTFDNAVIAVGSRIIQLPDMPADDRIIGSTGALQLADIPKRLLIIGGGIIGLEMATIYSALGSGVSIVELQPQLIPGADADVVKPLATALKDMCANIWLRTRVTEVKAQKSGIKVSFADDGEAPNSQTFDTVLVAVGRRPNGDLINANAAGVRVDERGFIAVNDKQQTNVPHIYAIGDVVGQPMLAHKATHEAKVAAEVIAGEAAAFTPMTIPSVAYTDPEVAWAGLTETTAKANGVAYEKAVFPWAASGRALGIDRTDGMTKLLYDPDSKRVLGGAIVGVNAGELIAEIALAVEMGADVEDVGLTIHPHPTLSETVCFAAEMAAGTITDLPPPRRKSGKK